jgi:lysylphosphatidylglycerol synthetase-like protein (DUF2156 family)/UDP-2,3-diacylglucosamine pyrophosphatase LpxH
MASPVVPPVDSGGVGDAGLAPGAAVWRSAAPLESVRDLIEIDIPRRGRVVMVSDLHLTGTMTPASTGTTEELIDVLADWPGPGAFIIAGDGFEQLHEPVSPIGDILDAHQRFTDAVAAFARQIDHHVVVLSGNHDGNIAWDGGVVEELTTRLGATAIGLSVDVVLDTGAGSKRVHVVHGNQDDKYNAFEDPRSPLDTPTGHHVVRQVLPQLDRAVRPGGLLDGLYWLSEPMQAGEMVGSRLLYRGLARKAWLLTIPFLAAILLRLFAFLPDTADDLGSVEEWIIGFGLAVLVILVLAIVVAGLTLLGVHQSLASTEIGERTGVGAHNAEAREHGARLIELGYDGMVTGHTHQPELSVVGDGFYANTGCGVEVLVAQRARLGLPRPFTSVLRMSRVELSAQAELEVHLVSADVPVPVMSRLERAVMKVDRDTPTTPSVVASLPTGGTWPSDPTTLGTFARMRRARRRGAFLLIAIAALNVLSAAVGPTLRNFAIFQHLVPDRYPRAAGVIVVLISVALIGLARGIRRGYRQSWIATLVLLLASAVVLVSRGDNNIEEGIINLALATWLFVDRRQFRVMAPGRRRWGLWAAALTAASVGLAAILAIELQSGERISRTAIALAVGLVILLALTVRRPAGHHLREGEARAAAEREGIDTIRRLGGDTFDHSAVRADKALLFASGGLVSYAVLDGIMVVSPDPVCGPDERSDIWASTMDFADTHGWRVTVLAANAGWLPIYHAAGLHDVYLGDEAIVDTGRFIISLPDPLDANPDARALADRGYHVEIVTPANITASQREALERIATEAELGAIGEGFATSLGRLATTDDDGAILALAIGPDGQIVACNQFVPAPAIDGYTLDLSSSGGDPEAGAALAYLLLAESITWMYHHDARAVSLGLAASAGVDQGEARSRLPVGRRVMAQFAHADELERRRGVNEQFSPVWRPRYIVTDTMRSALARNRAR